MNILAPTPVFSCICSSSDDHKSPHLTCKSGLFQKIWNEGFALRGGGQASDSNHLVCPIIWLSEAAGSLGWNNMRVEWEKSSETLRESVCVGGGGGVACVYAYVCGIRLHSLSLTRELQLWDQDRLLHVWGSSRFLVGGSQVGEEKEGGGAREESVCGYVCKQVVGAGSRIERGKNLAWSAVSD